MLRSFSLWMVAVCGMEVVVPSFAQSKVLVCDRQNPCVQQGVHGQMMKTLADDVVRVSVSLSDTGKYLRLVTTVENRSAAAITIDPQKIVLREIAPKEKAISAVSAKKALHGAGSQDEVAKIFADAGRMPSGTGKGTANWSTTYDSGKKKTTTTGSYTKENVPGPMAADQTTRADALTYEHNALQSAKFDLIDASPLEAGPLNAGKSIAGVIFFERDKKGRSFEVSVPVGETVYRFTFSLNR
jgi:hypothetical protein